METLTRLVSESLARHGFDRPLDYRRLQWSRWFRCESHHSLLVVPSKPGVFALAEEIMDLGPSRSNGEATKRAEAAASSVPRSLSEAKGSGTVPFAEQRCISNVEERRFSAASEAQRKGASAPASPEADSARRMLAVTQFFEDDDMAYVLDRMLSRNHAMRARLESGPYFVRFVEIQDEAQRRSICSALNQWIASSSEKAIGIGSHFASSLELTPTTEPTSSNVGRTPIPEAGTSQKVTSEPRFNNPANQAAPPEVVAVPGVQRSSLFPSGF
jgi:hypothetical protein